MKLVFLVSDEMKVFHDCRGKKKHSEVLLSLQGTKNLLIQSKSNQNYKNSISANLCSFVSVRVRIN